MHTVTATHKASFGLIGLGVMGRNLALNVEDHGFRVAVWTRKPEDSASFARAHPGKRIVAAGELAELVAGLEAPRRILLMVTAGAAVDGLLETLLPLLSAGDVVLDGGNSWYEDTRRRERQTAAWGVRFVGLGVSGGEEGARRGPSLMPGCSAEAWAAVRPVLEAIAARTEDGACVTHVGPDGAGHFVKMVHNGIEYADMQLIAEAYDVLRRALGFDVDELAATFARWNQGPLASFLIEITAKILRVRDADGRPLVDQVLDQAEQKGTGRWTVRTALDVGVPVPSIAAALDARGLSSRKDERVYAEKTVGALDTTKTIAAAALVDRVRDALLAAKLCAYAQGFDLIRHASREHGWKVDPAELARIWKGGCIIRARVLDDMRAAFRVDPELPHLLVAPSIAALLRAHHGALRETLALAQSRGIPVPAMAASLAYFDSYRTADLPQNLTQAQRDAFGAHGYKRRDDPGGAPRHTEWLAE